MSWIQSLICLSLCLALLGGAPAAAAEHLVSPAELASQLETQQAVRDQSIRTLRRTFESVPGQAALRSVGLDAKRVTTAVASLDDETLHKLAARAATLERDLAGGALTNEHLTYIVIALATAVIVILAV